MNGFLMRNSLDINIFVHFRCLKWRALEQWRRLHAILMIERETESRRARWRNKIHELVPDYTPNAMDYKPKF